MDRAKAIERLELHRKACGFPMMPHMESASAAADWVMRMELLSEALSLGIAALREQEQSQWISVEERLPDAAQGMEGVLGFVNGYNGRITFTDAYLFVKYDYAENVWWSEDYDIEGCKVTHWMPLPEPPKEGAEG